MPGLEEDYSSASLAHWSLKYSLHVWAHWLYLLFSRTLAAALGDVPASNKMLDLEKSTVPRT